jgi:hypothetical protein
MTDISIRTEQQFKAVMNECRTLFCKKLHDYGASWRILRPSSLTDQLFIKAKRIRSLEIKKESLVGEGIRPEFIALINYGIVGLIQLEKGFVDEVDMTPDEAMVLYDKHADEALSEGNRRYPRTYVGVGRNRRQLYGYHKLCRVWRNQIKRGGRRNVFSNDR